MRSRRGYLIIDAAFGMALIGALIAILAAGVSQYQRAAKRLAQQRQAVRLAEEALTRLQFAEAPGAEVSVTMDPVPPAGLPDQRWTTVTVTLGDTSARLTGLAPLQHLEAAPEVSP